jgi:hypothetical protein
LTFKAGFAIFVVMKNSKLSSVAASLFLSANLLLPGTEANAQTATPPLRRTPVRSTELPPERVTPPVIKPGKSGMLSDYKNDTSAQELDKMSKDLATSRADALRKKDLSKEQIETIDQLYKQFGYFEIEYALSEDNKKCGTPIKDKSRYYQNFPHPALVGKNVVFSIEWMPYIVGPNQKITPAQLAKLRDNLDKAYNSYNELMPHAGQKIIIRIHPNVKKGDAHAHYLSDHICLKSDSNSIQSFWEEVANGSWSHALLHEIAHAFTMGKNMTGGEGRYTRSLEPMAEFFVSYALEDNKDAWYYIYDKLDEPEITRGNQHRLRAVQTALIESQKPNFPAFTDNAFESTAYGFYLHGLVSKVGWDTYKKAFRSYSDNTFQSKYVYTGDRDSVNAFDLFERIAFFSKNPKTVLFSLPDKGQLLKKFEVTVTPREVKETDQKPATEIEETDKKPKSTANEQTKTEAPTEKPKETIADNSEKEIEIGASKRKALGKLVKDAKGDLKKQNGVLDLYMQDWQEKTASVKTAEQEKREWGQEISRIKGLTDSDRVSEQTKLSSKIYTDDKERVKRKNKELKMK